MDGASRKGKMRNGSKILIEKIELNRKLTKTKIFNFLSVLISAMLLCLLEWRKLLKLSRRRGSSVSVVSGYVLDDRTTADRSPAKAGDFSSSLCVQTGSGAHPASRPIGTGVLSPGVKRGRDVTLTTDPHLVPRSIMSRSYTFSPPAPP